MPLHIPRTAWPLGFPDVIIHGDLRSRNSHPDYSAAKAGDAEAATRLAEDMLSGSAIQQVIDCIGGQHVVMLAVVADEIAGFNAIPDAMAQVIAGRIAVEVQAGTVIQANKVGHTKSDGWHRLVTPAIFIGDAIRDAAYFLVDDHVGFGGTLANLRGFLEENGAKVIGMTALTETPKARQIAVRPSTLDMLRSKHGYQLDQFWREQFGHGLDCLTDIEAGYLCRVESVAAIKNRMAEAAELARGRGISAVNIAAGT